MTGDFATTVPAAQSVMAEVLVREKMCIDRDCKKDTVQKDWEKWSNPLLPGMNGLPAASRATTPEPSVMVPIMVMGRDTAAATSGSRPAASAGMVKRSS